jgi:hypothetical protein
MKVSGKLRKTLTMTRVAKLRHHVAGAWPANEYEDPTRPAVRPPVLHAGAKAPEQEMEAEAVIAAAARAEAYAVMSAECFAQIAARRVQEGWV